MHPELIASSEQARVFDQPENNGFDSEQIIELLRALAESGQSDELIESDPVDEADVAGIPRPLPRSRDRSPTRYWTVMQKAPRSGAHSYASRRLSPGLCPRPCRQD